MREGRAWVGYSGVFGGAGEEQKSNGNRKSEALLLAKANGRLRRPIGRGKFDTLWLTILCLKKRALLEYFAYAALFHVFCSLFLVVFRPFLFVADSAVDGIDGGCG
jgi:hypothetical protein